mgnify:CR=1 FL=1
MFRVELDANEKIRVMCLVMFSNIAHCRAAATYLCDT